MPLNTSIAIGDPLPSTLNATNVAVNAATAVQATTLTIARVAPGATITVQKDVTTGFWPASYGADGTPVYTSGSASAGVRPTARADVTIIWKGADPGPAIVTTGTAGARQDIDVRFRTP